VEILRSGLRRINLWNSRIVLALAALGLIVIGGLWPASSPAAATAGINQTINFQGRLLNAAGAVVPDGVYNMRFKIYQDGTGCVSTGSSPCGGTLMWTETRENVASQGVTVKNGYFSLALGSVNAFGSSIDWNQDTLWLSTDIGGTSTGAGPTYDGEMLPFKRLSSAPYALQAQNANTCVTCILQAPTSTAQNTISPTTNSVVGLTVNATSGTSAVALAVTQSKTADAATISLTNTTGTNTNALLVNRNGSGGTTTNGIMIQNTAGTLTNGLSFSGTIGTDINRASGTLTIQGASGVAVDSGASGTITIGTASSATVNINNTANSSTTNIGTNGLANATVNIGSTGGTSATLIQGGANASGISVQTAAGGTISIGTAASSTIFIGNNATTANLVLGQSTDSNTISIGNGNTATTKTQTINIGAGTPAGTGAASITIGNTANASTLNLQAGTGNINLITNSASAGVLVKPSADSATAFQVRNSTASNNVVLGVDTATSNISILSNTTSSTSTTTLGAFASTTAMSVGSSSLDKQRVRGGSVAYNGYLYQIGGVDGNGNTIATVEYAKLNADGSVGSSWTNTTAIAVGGDSFPARRQFQPVVVNGYLYVIGGRDNNGAGATRTTSYYAKINSDGSIGSWASTTPLSTGGPATGLFAHGTVAYNGYIYVVGGFNGSVATQTAVYSIKVNADGTLGSSWSTTGITALSSARAAINGTLVVNGYLYVLGGYDGSTNNDTIIRTPLTMSGGTGSWTTQTGMILGGGDENFLGAVANGWLYIMGGDNGSRVSAYQLNADGSVGTGVSLSTTFPSSGVSLGEAGVASANGYIYILGGSSGADGSGTVRNNVYYAASSRIKVGGNLDLVGYSGETLTEGGSGGQLTAGNTQVVGTLQVQGATSLAQSLSVGDALSVNGTAAFQNATNSTAALQVKNASGTTILDVDTTNGRVGIGNAAPGYALDVTGDINASANLRTGGTIRMDNAGALTNVTADTAILTSGTLGVARGGTGLASTTAYGLLFGGTTSTGAFQSLGTGTSGQVLQSNGPGALPSWVGGAGCSTCIAQVPTTTVQNTITPTTASVVALTVNGTSSTAAQALIVNQSQSGAATAEINSTNTSGTQTNGLLVNRNGASGTTTNGINITQTAGTLTNGLAFTGTIGTDINRSSGTLTLQGTGGVSITAGTTNAVTVDSAGAGSVLLGNTNATTITVGSTSSTGTLTVGQSTASNTINIGNGTIAAGNTGTINIGTSATSTGKTAVAIGSTNDGSSLALQSGIGGVNITVASASSGGSAGTVVKSGTNNSTAAFQVQNASSVAFFTVDTTNERLYVGPTAGDTVGAILVLGNKTTSGDPTGVAGSIYYNSNTGKLRCYEGDGAWIDCVRTARTSFYYYNELTTVNDDGIIAFTQTGSGASPNGSAIGSVASHPGIVQLQTGTSASANVSIASSDSNGSSMLLGNGDYWRYDTALRISTLSTSGQRYSFRAGFTDTNADSDGTDGCFFKYSDNVNSGKWQGVCISNGGTAQTCDTTITATAAAWVRLTVAVNTAGTSADFQVNGVSKCQVTSGIPTGANRQTTFQTELWKEVGTTNVNAIDLDYFEVMGQFGTSR